MPVKRAVLRVARLILLQGSAYYHRQLYTPENVIYLLPIQVWMQLEERIKGGQKYAREAALSQRADAPSPVHPEYQSPTQRAARLLYAEYQSTVDAQADSQQ